MKFLKTYDNFVNEGKFPMNKWIESHMVSWLSKACGRKLIKKIAEKIGHEYSVIKTGDSISFKENINERLNELGIEINQDPTNLNIVLRSIRINGIPWIQLYNRPEFGKIRGSLMSFENEKDLSETIVRSEKVLKNLNDVEAIKEEVLKRHGHESKKGFNKEIHIIAKEMQFKPEWDEQAINELAVRILKSVPKALDKI